MGRPTSRNPVIQLVALLGNVSPDDGLSETEILTKRNNTLNQTALDRAVQWNGWRGRMQPGATAQSQEMLFTFEFLANRR